ncbi:hypothetical protein ACLOAU_11250 [Niabella sp. CJ426]|uniref:hypothetical protein n=1 Tax=Niabella sp. CJ426 TaxID=3393740 RepID=UPI003D02440F
MKNLLLILMLAVVVSCGKDEELPQPKTILVSQSTTVSTSATTVVKYNRNASGRLLSYGSSSKDSVAIDYDARGNISAMRFTYLNQNRWEYTYDGQNRLVSKQGYNSDGTKGSEAVFTYFDDRLEMLQTYPNGSTNKHVYFYTADKKNVSNYKLYGTSGKVAQDETYTISNVKAPRFGYEAVNGFINTNASEKTVRVEYDNSLPDSPAKTTTFFSKIVANESGYPASIEYSASNSTAISTRNYDYIAW